MQAACPGCAAWDARARIARACPHCAARAMGDSIASDIIIAGIVLAIALVIGAVILSAGFKPFAETIALRVQAVLAAQAKVKAQL